MRRITVRKRARSGFSLVEILIAVAVLSVGILGVCASLAFGMRASSLGPNTTVGVNFSRKILEEILGGGSLYSPASSPGASGALVINGPWDTQPGDPIGDPTNSGKWHQIDAAPLDKTQFAATTAEQTRFATEYAPNFQRNVYVSAIPAGLNSAMGGAGLAARTVLVNVTVRWVEHGTTNVGDNPSNWRYVSTVGMFTNK